MSVTESDKLFLRAAISLAGKGMYQSPPNPSVGCVLVGGGKIIGRGWTRHAGGNHAEIEALQNARLQGAGLENVTAYVSLEPCCFVGRTPACTEALVKAGIKRVVCAAKDPNPRVSGKGLQALEDAGLQVELVELEDAARLNPGFNKRMRQQLPWVRVKSAMSLDGRTAMASGESQWITGRSSREDVQHWRARSSAIITGSGTVVADNPRLTVRGEHFESTSTQALDKREANIRQPLRVVLDGKLSCSPSAAVFEPSSPSMVVTLQSADAERLAIFEALPNTRVVIQKGANINLKQVLEELARLEMNEVLVEAGARLTGAFLKSALWDEALIYIAPKLMGQSAMPLAGFALEKMAEAFNFTFKDVTRFDQDIRIRALNAHVDE